MTNSDALGILCGGGIDDLQRIVRFLEKSGFRIVKEKGSIRYYGKAGCPRLVRLNYHGAKEIPTGTCQSILRAAGLK